MADRPVLSRRYRALAAAIDGLRAMVEVADDVLITHGPRSDHEAEACNAVMVVALKVAVAAAELEGNARMGDPTALLLARVVVAENAAGMAREAAPFPLDQGTAYLHAAATLLELAGEELICAPAERGRHA